MSQPIRVLIVDDHAIVREGLRTLLDEESGIEVAADAANGAQAIDLTVALQPDVILMDLVMPEMDGIETIRRIRKTDSASQIIVLTSFGEDQRVRSAIQAGAIGYMLKDVLQQELLRAIESAARGEPALHPEAQRALMRQATDPSAPFEDLTERELDVLRLIAQGKSNRDIAAALFLTEGTVKGYVSAILAKLQVDDRTQAALFAVKNGLVPEM